MHAAIQLHIGGPGGRGCSVFGQPPHALHEAPGTIDAGFRPRQIAFRRAVGQHEPAHGISTVTAQNGIGIDDILLGLRHLDDAADLDRQAVILQCRTGTDALHLVRREPHGWQAFTLRPAVGLVGHHALREEAGERFGHIEHADVLQGTRPETGIEQVQDGMLHPADILAHRQPLRRHRRIERAIIGRAGEANEIPRRIGEGVERIGLATGRLAALRAIHMLPRRVAIERVPRHIEGHVFGQNHRQLLLRHRHDAADLAVDDRDRRAPVTLAAYPPIAQAILRHAFAPASGLGPRNHGGAGVVGAHAVEEARVHHAAGAGIGLVMNGGVFLALGSDDAGHRQLVFAGKIEVALIVTGASKQCAGAIIHQHEIGDKHRQADAGIERVDDAQAGVKAQLFLGFDIGRCSAAGLTFGDKRRQCRVGFRALASQRMISGDRSETGTEQRIGPGGEHVETAAALYRKGEAQPSGAADPVFLHQFDLVRPLIERLEPVDQIVGEIGDLQEPLVQLAAFDQRARSPAAAVDHLLVGQHGHVDRIPVHRRFLAVHQPGGQHVEEQRLFLAVIIRLAGGQLA